MIPWPQGIAFENQSRAVDTIRLARRFTASIIRRTAGVAVLIVSKLPHTPKTAALGVSLILSALLTAEAVLLPERHWLAWISFLPLFIVVRSLRPSAASLAGGFWGGSLPA